MKGWMTATVHGAPITQVHYAARGYKSEPHTLACICSHSQRPHTQPNGQHCCSPTPSRLTWSKCCDGARRVREQEHENIAMHWLVKVAPTSQRQGVLRSGSQLAICWSVAVLCDHCIITIQVKLDMREAIANSVAEAAIDNMEASSSTHTTT